MHSCNLTFDRLPDVLPIFPLAGVLLLPHGHLPLNIFEAPYLKMIDDALAGDRLIGMIQPRTCKGAPVYDIGCAGRIINFAEAEGGRYLVTLAGTCRFKIGEELGEKTLYRRVKPDWTGFADDMQPQAKTVSVDRAKLNRLLQSYFRQQEMSCDWDKVDIAADTDLLTALEMICPLKPSEKQALLEAANVQSRTELFLAMIEMAVSHQGCDDEGCCHQMPSVDPKLLELLVCPLTKTSLRFDSVKNELISDTAGLAFPIRGGVPVMMASEARHLEERERIKN